MADLMILNCTVNISYNEKISDENYYSILPVDPNLLILRKFEPTYGSRHT